MKLTKKTAIIFTAALLVLVPTVVTVYAHSSGPGIGKGRWSLGSHNLNGTFRSSIVPILMGHGFALNPSDETQYHILDVTAMKVSNETQSQTRGNIKFEGQPYGLKITDYTNTSLSGNIETVPSRGTNYSAFTPAKVGTITLSISNYEGQKLATGTITVNNTSYNVLLTSPLMASGGELHMFNVKFSQHRASMGRSG
jgi:hypothetical protein